MMPLLRAAVFIASSLLFAAAMTPFMTFSHLLSDLPSHFQAYILLFAPPMAALAFLLRQPAPLAFPAVIAAGLSFAHIWPYLPHSTAEAPDTAHTVKLLQVNVYTRNQDTAALAALIRQEKPDMVVLAEVNLAFVEMGEALHADYPHRFYTAKTAVLSRLPLEEIALSPGEGSLTRPQFFRVVAYGRPFTLSTFHAASPPPGLARRDAQFAEYAALVGQLRAQGRMDGPLVFAGDINATPYAPAMKKLVADLGVRNAREGHGLVHSWPVWLPAPLRIPIDHVLVSAEIDVVDYSPGPPVGSDHLPTIARLRIGAGG